MSAIYWTDEQAKARPLTAEEVEAHLAARRSTGGTVPDLSRHEAVVTPGDSQVFYRPRLEQAHPDASYWDRGVASVPHMTGAAHLLDGRDLRSVLDRLGLEGTLADVLDVGCGTGRAAQLCEQYMGADIAASAVAYCRQKNLHAVQIAGPEDLPARNFGTILCISVFTHMGRDERRRYLQAFRPRCARLVADIIRGDGTGGVEVWTAREDEYLADLADAGFAVQAVTPQQWDMWLHTYYLAVPR